MKCFIFEKTETAAVQKHIYIFKKILLDSMFIVHELCLILTYQG